jgi:predicted permease
MTERILLFFALAALGYAVRRGGLIGPAGVRDLIRLNMDVCVPALVFATAAEHLTPEVAAVERGVAGPLLGLPLAAGVTVLAGMVLGWLTAPLAGVRGRRRKTYVYVLAFANAAFLPIPLSYALHGELGVLYVSLYTLGYTPLFWTLGTWILSQRVRWGFFLHPHLLALILGAAAGMTRTALPAPVMELIRVLGGSAIALALLYAGAVLAEQPLDLRRDLQPVSAIAAVKLVALPALALLAVGATQAPEPIRTQAVLQAAMPCMAQAGLYAARFGGDPGLASKATFATTLLCLVTVPLAMGRLG